MRARPIRRDAPSYSGPAWLGRTPHLVADNRGLIGYGLGKSFKRRPVLRDVSVSVQRGEVVGLLGPNGAGKTTCFYIITGLIAADTGTVELDGQDITELPMYRRARLGIGVLITDHNVRDTLKIVDRAYILHEGRVLMEGAPDEIVADADVRRVYLGERFSL